MSFVCIQFKRQQVLFDPLTGLRCYHIGPSEPESNGNEKLLCIPQSSSITGAPTSDCLISYSGLVGGSVYAESVYSTAPIDWTA